MNVLITGGTSGIGYALAKVFAKNGYNLILSSSNPENLKGAQQKLQKEFGASVSVIEQDLSKIGGAKKLYSKITAEEITIDILVNNAGYGLVGNTEEIDFDKDEQMMILNVISLVELCKLFLPEMYARRSGKILNVASTGAFQPGPYSSTYFASKSFVLSYSRAARYEAKKHNVQICTLCPGATRTQFFTKEGQLTPNNSMSAESVAEYAYKQLMKNKAVFISGLINKLMQAFPTSIKMASVAKMKSGSNQI